MSSVSPVQMADTLNSEGWREVRRDVWVSPTGGWFREIYAAWAYRREMSGDKSDEKLSFIEREAQLIAAGWKRVRMGIYRSPCGSCFHGPFKAWHQARYWGHL